MGFYIRSDRLDSGEDSMFWTSSFFKYGPDDLLYMSPFLVIYLKDMMQCLRCLAPRVDSFQVRTEVGNRHLSPELLMDGALLAVRLVTHPYPAPYTGGAEWQHEKNLA